MSPHKHLTLVLTMDHSVLNLDHIVLTVDHFVLTVDHSALTADHSVLTADHSVLTTASLLCCLFPDPASRCALRGFSLRTVWSSLGPESGLH